MSRGPVLVVARAARQLAAAARAAGYTPFVVDLFGDTDTRALAAASRVTPAGPGFTFGPRRLPADLDSLAATLPPDTPLVYGAGFEAAPVLLARLAARHPLLGCPPESLELLRRPRAFACLLDALDIPRPALALARAPRRGRWLVKRAGQAGGWHVRPARAGALLGADEYAQALVPGRSLSVAFVAHEAGARVLGWAAHLGWREAQDAYAYAGAIGGVAPPARVRGVIERALPRLVAALGLRGLCGCDFVLGPDGDWSLLELNARPTASFDLLAPPGTAFRAHLAACRGERLPAWRARAGCHAQAVCHTPVPIRIAESIHWPDWVADRPGAGARLPRGAPLCTVRAVGSSPEDARAKLARRLVRLHRQLGLGEAQEPVFRHPA